MDRRTRHKIVLALWLTLFFLLGFGVWNFQAGHLMILAYCMLSVILYGCYAFLSRCPRCGLPILLKPTKILGMQLYAWSILAPERCRHCGEMLE
ncbi:MAG TPA: hypothetical protein VEM40_11805 [Nitrospirota bacterium]|nr:hypothetical protein [Nitrospirota bacterium]